ncbi:MAG: phospholipase D family protein [Candidatus Omnitrophota bacterium]|nr:phospholipase D family protein [Candidatus Omnitrophota bacterium]
MKLYEFVQFHLEEKLIRVIKEAEKELFIATPYIKDYGIGIILNNVRTMNLKILTNLDLANISSSGFDIESLSKLWTKFNVSIASLGKLHAKAYIADDKVAFLTSANLTHGGLRENYEYGVVFRDRDIVSIMLNDINKYFNLGNVFNRETIEDIKSEVEDIRELRQRIEKNIGLKNLNRLLKQKKDNLQTKILRNRIKGKTINSIFAETIKYLLEKEGALSTKELHPFIQNIHPDICDDTVDRVIDGQHFGKKWKHLVRDAQQSLKKKRLIYLKEKKWHLAS